MTGRTGTARRRVLHVALILGALVMLYPLLWMVGSSLKPDNQIFGDLTPWPSSATFRNYVNGWTAQNPSFTRYFLNSFIVAVGSVVGNVIACSMAAYAFGRLRFRFRNAWFAVMLASIMLPAHALLIPQYTLYYRLGWVNTDLPLIVPKFLATDAFFIFMMVQFIRSLPRELDEAAALDGCGPYRTFLLIIFPLLRPALVTTMIFTFIWTYNDFFVQLIYLTLPNSQTVPVALRNFLDASSGQSSYGSMLAMSVLSLVPTFVVFLVSQRRIVEGVATTGLRG
ncbi:MAG TPA: carbohydrate ABC transporter permease [Spirillospora sp.]|nr:carbohydrate ABC transporter permease [Spirillospora sp.]